MEVYRPIGVSAQTFLCMHKSYVHKNVKTNKTTHTTSNTTYT